VCRVDTKGTDALHPCDPQRPEDFYFFELDYDTTPDATSDLVIGNQTYTRGNGTVSSNQTAAIYAFKSVRPGNWSLYYLYGTPKQIGRATYPKEKTNVSYTGIDFNIPGQGGVYVIALTGDVKSAKKRVFQVVPDNVISILWQVPQIVVITAAEILFSITGYEFAYSQAAPSMKALVQALWLLTTAVGDSIIVLIAYIDPFGTDANPANMAWEFLGYAVAMFVVIVIFALMSIFYYDYNYYTGEDGSDDASDYTDEEDTDESSPSRASVRKSAINDAYETDDDCWNTKL
jgi:hypothetical protein